jgi:hypothetical protein
VRLPTFAQHRRFCEVDDWVDRDAQSRRATGDHHRYMKTLPNGDTLYTRISHGSGQYRNPSLWKHILRDQLKVSEDEFWDAVDNALPPSRGWAQPKKPEGEPIPYWLVGNLTRLVGLPQKVVASMTLEEAMSAWQEWQMTPVLGENDAE